MLYDWWIQFCLNKFLNFVLNYCKSASPQRSKPSKDHTLMTATILWTSLVRHRSHRILVQLLNHPALKRAWDGVIARSPPSSRCGSPRWCDHQDGGSSGMRVCNHNAIVDLEHTGTSPYVQHAVLFLESIEPMNTSVYFVRKSHRWRVRRAFLLAWWSDRHPTRSCPARSSWRLWILAVRATRFPKASTIFNAAIYCEVNRF